MTISTVSVVLLLAIPILAGMFRWLDPGRAVLGGGIFGLLFLPRDGVLIGVFPLYKTTAIGLGLILGVVIFDRRGLRGARPRARDLPMILYLALVPIGLIAGGMAVWRDVLDQTAQRWLGVGVPYLLARLYFGDHLGPRRVLAAIVLAGLACLPFCLWEEILGPPWFWARLIYGLDSGGGQVERLGGYRPEVFCGNGLELAAWIALAAVAAVGMTLGRDRLVPRLPEWVPAVALVGLSISCRGVYGYALLVVGLPALLLAWVTRSRWPLVALALIPPAYVVARSSGVWDGQAVVRAARGVDHLTGGHRQESSVGFRIGAEDAFRGAIGRSHAILGYGSYGWNAPGLPWPDGFWIHLFWSGGFAGLAAWLASLELWPVAWTLCDPPRRPRWWAEVAPRWTLALLLILAAVDSLHNMTPTFPTALLAGSLVGGRGPLREMRFR